MDTKELLRLQVREYYGTEEIPLKKSVNISSLPLNELQAEILSRNLNAEGNREHLESVLVDYLGCNEVTVCDIVKIDSLTVPELEKIISENIKPYMELEYVGKKVRKSIRQAQQELAENCGFQHYVTWDLLHECDDDIMKNKIRQLIPDKENCRSAIENLREDIFKSVWAQRKYTNRNSVTYIFYVMVTKVDDNNRAPDSTEFSCHPVFRCKKCDDNFNSKDCCMVYVDEEGRVYENWKSYINDNTLPAGIMVTPRKGIYNFTKDGQVVLDIYCTPKGTVGAKIMKGVTRGTSITGLGAACVPLAAFFMPVAAPVLATSAAVGAGVGIFNAVTSSLHLVDRKKHQQSISITNKNSRSCYIGLASAAAGVAASGAVRAMTYAASAGKATAGLELIVNGMNVTSIVLSGSGIANGVLDIIMTYSDGDEISALDVLQLSASLVLFTHSVYNFQLASQIANNARNSSIKSYRETLSNRQRRMFDKISKETIRINGSKQGQIDIIRNINKIPDRQYLNDLFKINKQLNKNNIRPAFDKAGGGIILNNELNVDTSVLRQSVQHQKGPNILQQISQPIPTTETPQSSKLLYSYSSTNYDINLKDPTTDKSNLTDIAKNLQVVLANGVIILLKQYGEDFTNKIADVSKLKDIIESMADNFTDFCFNFILSLTQEFLETTLKEIEKEIKLYVPTESVLYQIVKYVLDNYSSANFDLLQKQRDNIIKYLKSYYMSFTTKPSTSSFKTCPICKGKFNICQL